MENTSPYRPHDPGHDYYGRGVYLITLVVRGREAVLGTLGKDPLHPVVQLLPTGEIVQEEWEKTAVIQQQHGRKIRLLAQVIMPDHWHGVVEVEEDMDKSVGAIIQAVKSACTARWWRMTGAMLSPSSADRIRTISTYRREEYYASHDGAKPLFDANYDDTICLDERHREAMIRYVEDNPRRAIIRDTRPDFMQRRLHVQIEGRDKNGRPIRRDYAAFGNLFLLRWARKVQVFCHRKARYGQLNEEEKARCGVHGAVSEKARCGVYGAVSENYTTAIPYVDTAAFREERETWRRMLMEGATVLVTPGISPGELQIKNECLKEHLPLIHLQKEPIGAFWKPEKSRFEACEHGMLLILAPWEVEGESDYAQFHNMNELAAEICAFEGGARVVG